MATTTNHIPGRSGPGSTTAALPSGNSRGGSGKWTKKKKKHGERYDHNWNLECKNVTTEWKDGDTGGRDGSLELEHPGSIGDALNGRWEGATEAGYKTWFCGGDKEKVHRVGFLVNKNTKNSILECTPVNNMIMAVRVVGKPFNMTIVQVYAPKSESSDEIIDEF